MQNFEALRELPQPAPYNEKDVLVVFGEAFSGGYINGLIEAAQTKGMKIIYSTVGRRDKNNVLRPLTEDEIKEKNQSPLINIPLEAGFDLEPAKSGRSPVDQLSGTKMSEWASVKLNWDEIEESKMAGIENFRQRLTAYFSELKQHIPPSANVLFAHTMAGGFPRAKVVMPAANKVFKGFGERYTSSEMFWQSDIGRLFEMCFNEVTGETLKHLVDMSEEIRNEIEKNDKKVTYVAYGYHGTEVLVGEDYHWQSYSPYLPGFAKLRLEEIANQGFAKNINVEVFNAPEILTNSSSIFLGVEVSLYPLMGALQKEGLSNERVQKILGECQALLKDDNNIEEILNYCTKYLTSETIKTWSSFEKWPQHNGPEQMKLMREASSDLIAMHRDNKNLITSKLSELVFKSCGKIMLNESWQNRKAVWWIGHDIIAKQFMN